MITAIGNRYEILDLLGEGGMGRVYAVRDTLEDRDVALKLLKSAQNLSLDRLKHEFWIMTRMRHPHIVEVHDYGISPDGLPYFTMERVSGTGLDASIPASPRHVREWLVPLLEALDSIHQQGYVHGDLKPANIRVREDGVLKLMDFGLMEPAGREGGPIRGTLWYVAPEIVRGDRIDARADLYALGAVTYHLLAGRPPFEQTRTIDLVRAIATDQPAPLASGDAELDGLVMRLLEKDPVARPGSARAVLRAIGVQADDTPTRTLEPRLTGFEDLTTRIRERMDGVGGTLYIQGSEGSGKTRLGRELLLEAQLADHLTCGLKGTEPPVPYGAVATLVETLVPLARSSCPAILETHRHVLSLLVPDLAAGEPYQALEPEQELRRLQASILELVGAIARTRGLTVVIDDSHLLDEASRETLAFLGRAANQFPLWMIHLTAATQAPEDALSMPALTASDVERVTLSMLGTSPIAPELRDDLYAHSEGHPQTLVELVRHLVRSGLLVREAAGWTVRGGIAADTSPRSLAALWGGRLEGLDDLERRLAQVLALAEHPLAVGDLAGFVEPGTGDALYRALMVLEQLHITQSASDGYGIPSLPLRSLLRESVSAPDRREWNAKLAEVLERTLSPAPQSVAILNSLTRHLFDSPTPEKAIPLALRAGERNLELFATDLASVLLLRGLALVRNISPVDEEALLRYLVALGDVHRLKGEFAEAGRSLEEGADLARKLEARATLARVLGGLGKVRQAMGAYDDAMRILEEAANAAQDAHVPRERLRALTSLARVHVFKGQTPQTVEVFTRALHVAREHDLEAYQAECQSFLGFLYTLDPLRQDEGLAMLQEALTIHQSTGNKIGLNDTLMHLGNAYQSLGRYAEAKECYLNCQQINSEIGQHDEEVFSLLNLGVVGYHMGDFTEALELSNQALALVQKLGSRYPESIALALVGYGHMVRGQVYPAWQHFDQAVAIAESIHNVYLDVNLALYRADALSIVRRDAEALVIAQDALNVAEEKGIEDVRLALEVKVGILLARTGKRDEGRERLTAARKKAREARARGMQLRASHGLAWIAGHARDFAEAQKLAHAALQDARETQARAMEAELEALLGEVQLLQERRSLASEHLHRAAKLAQQLDMPFLQATVAALLARTEPARSDRHLQSVLAIRQRILDAAEPQDRAALERSWENSLLALDASAASVAMTIEGRLQGLVDDVTDILSYVKVREARWSSIELAHERLEQLIEFAHKINQVHDLRLVLELAMDLIIDIVGAERGFLLLYQGNQLVVSEMRNILPQEGDDDWLISRSIADEVFQTEQPIVLQDALSDRRFQHSESIQALNLRTVLCVPLKIRNQVVGALYVDRRTIGTGFSEGDLDVVVSLATLSATAIDNANLYHELETKSHQMEALNNLARVLATTHHLEDVLTMAVQLTLEVARSERCYLLLWDKEELVCRAISHKDATVTETEADVSEQVCARVMETGEPLLLESVPSNIDVEGTEGALRQVMCVPLVAKQRLLGLLYVDAPLTGHLFHDKDLTLMEAISHHVSVAIENAHLYLQLSTRASELETLVELYEEANMRASSDALTGLQNRRFFLDQLDRSFAQAKRHRRHLSLLMIDIDHFKSFNDTYGHTMGDQVLVGVSQALGYAVRLADVVARYGGEEFIVALPDTDLEGALKVAERMRESVTELSLSDELGQPLRSISISIGVSSLRLEDERTAELIERADLGLYEAKSRGRNQVHALED